MSGSVTYSIGSANSANDPYATFDTTALIPAINAVAVASSVSGAYTAGTTANAGLVSATSNAIGLCAVAISAYDDLVSNLGGQPDLLGDAVNYSILSAAMFAEVGIIDASGYLGRLLQNLTAG
jgi:hypothetical protein